MDNLIFSLNATVPIFLLMLLGLLFHRIGWIDDVFASKMNKFVFLIPLPLMVFEDLATVDFAKRGIRNLSCSALPLHCSVSLQCLRHPFCFATEAYRGNSFRRLTGAAPHFWEWHLSRTSMAMRGWRR